MEQVSGRLLAKGNGKNLEHLDIQLKKNYVIVCVNDLI